MDFLQDNIVAHFNFWVYVVLMMIGLWAMISKNNLIKKLIGMSIFQTAIILFFISTGVKEGAQIPVLDPGGKDRGAGHLEAAWEVDVDRIANPLPHVLMLTAIVVGVATLGVALSISQKIFKEFGTIEENEILEQIKKDAKDG